MVELEIPPIFRNAETPGSALPSFDPLGLRPAGQSITDFFTNLFKNPIDNTLSSQGKQVQTLTPKPGQLPSGNVIAGATTILGTTALLTLPIQQSGNSALSLLLPPGSGGVGKVLSQTTGFLTSPTGWLLIGGGILLILLSKK